MNTLGGLCMKKTILLIIPLLLAGCGGSNGSSNNQRSNSQFSSSIEQANNSNGALASSSKPFDSTPYAFEPGTITLPEDGEVDGRDWFGNGYDITAVNQLFISTSNILREDIFQTDWKYNVLLNDGAPKYASEDHKPVFEFDSVLLSDVNQLPETYRLKNTNVDIPTGSYKNYIYHRSNLDNSKYTTLVYHVRANAVYYTESFPSFDTFKEEASSHLTTFFVQRVSETCSTNTKESYAKFFRRYGTHVMWSCAYGMGAELKIEAYSSDYNLKEVNIGEVKNYIDRMALSGVDSKTVGEFEERRSFSLNNYLQVEKGKYIFDSLMEGSLYGGKAAIPSATISGFADTICSLLTDKTVDVKESAFLSPRESYPIWEILPSSMSSEKALLAKAYNEYLIDRADYNASQLEA